MSAAPLPRNTPDMLEWALWYAARGYRVFPLYEPVAPALK